MQVVARALRPHRNWWLDLPVSKLEKVNMQSDLDTLDFAAKQVDLLTSALKSLAANDPRVPRLVHLPGISMITALTILGAIGEIQRFSHAKQLVGYAGLGAKVHDSGQTTRTGRITKAGRKDLRAAMIEAAQTAANFHPFWQQELKRLEPRLGRNKAIVAIARKLLVSVLSYPLQRNSGQTCLSSHCCSKIYAICLRPGQRKPPH
jgi:transposase